MAKNRTFRPIDWLLFVTGICVIALNLVAPGIILVLAIGTVFLANPFATLTAFITTTNLVLICIRIIYRCWHSRGFGKLLLLFTATSTILALAVIPLVNNWLLDKDVKKIIASDFEKVPQIKNIKSVGIVQSGQTGCGELCKALLINDYAKEVIISKKDQLKDIHTSENLGTAYAFIKRSSCPAFGKYSDKTNSYKVDYKTYKANASDILRIKAAEGLCLEHQDKSIATADLIIETTGGFRNKNNRHIHLLFDRPIFSTHRTIYVKSQTGFSPIYKKSYVQYLKLTPILLIGFAPYGYDSADFWDFGFYRNSRYENAIRTSDTYGFFSKYVVPPTANTVADALGWNLKISESISSDQFRRIIVDALNEDHQPEIVIKNIIPDFMKHFKRLERRRQSPSEADVDLVLELIRNRKVPPPSGLGGAVKTIIAAYPEQTDEFAGALLDRIFSIKPRVVKENYFFDGLHPLDIAMTQIPKSELTKRKSEIKKLAYDAMRRVSASYTLRKIEVFGNSEVDTFFYLIDDAHKYKEQDNNNSEWSVPFSAGMRGICKLGSNGAYLVPKILERIRSDIIPVSWRRSNATISTLLSLGKNPEQIWEIWRNNGTDYSSDRFDSDIKRLQRYKRRTGGCNFR